MGIDMGAISPDSLAIILANNDAIVSVMIAETMVSGQPYSEKWCHPAALLTVLSSNLSFLMTRGQVAWLPCDLAPAGTQCKGSESGQCRG